LLEHPEKRDFLKGGGPPVRGPGCKGPQTRRRLCRAGERQLTEGGKGPPRSKRKRALFGRAARSKKEGEKKEGGWQVWGKFTLRDKPSGVI